MGKALCLACKTMYDRDFLNENAMQCPRTDCGAEVFDVDDLMVPTLIMLHDKGYISCNHCSGHYYSPLTDTYVDFIVPLEKLDKVIRRVNEFESDSGFKFRAMFKNSRTRFGEVDTSSTEEECTKLFEIIMQQYDDGLEDGYNSFGFLHCLIYYDYDRSRDVEDANGIKRSPTFGVDLASMTELPEVNYELAKMVSRF